MSDFAEIKDGKVIRVIVAEKKFVDTIPGEWIETSYDTIAGINTKGGIALRKNFALIGYNYNKICDAFYPPQPYLFWKLNPEKFIWEPPVPYPADKKFYVWDEKTINWKLVK